MKLQAAAILALILFSTRGFADGIFKKGSVYLNSESNDCAAVVDTFKHTFALATPGHVLQLNATYRPGYQSCEVDFTYSAPAEIQFQDYHVGMEDDACIAYKPVAMERVMQTIRSTPLAGGCGWGGYYPLIMKSDYDAATVRERGIITYKEKISDARFKSVIELVGGTNVVIVNPSTSSTLAYQVPASLKDISLTYDSAQITERAYMDMTSEYASADDVKKMTALCETEAKFVEAAAIDLHPTALYSRCYLNKDPHGNTSYEFQVRKIVGGNLTLDPKLPTNVWKDWVPAAGNDVKNCQNGRAEMLRLYPTYKGKTARHALCLTRPGTNDLYYLMMGRD